MINYFKGEYEFLSNFYTSPIEFEGQIYPSVENAYQAAKTLGDRSKFKNCTASIAKRFGKKVELRPDWEEVKIDIMTQLVSKKFNDPHLAAKLLMTGEQELIEGNWWGDTFWGICKGVGRNELGKILMKLRTQLRGQYE